MSYNQPAKAQGFAPSEHPEWVGQLFLIWPKSVEEVTFTRPDGTPDPTDIVTADVAIVTLVDPKTGQPTVLEDARIGGKALTPQLKKYVGDSDPVLGKFVQLPKQSGKNAAYCLEVPAGDSPEWVQMCQMAGQYEKQYPRQTYNAPQNGGSWNQTATPNAGWNQAAGTAAPVAATQAVPNGAWGAQPATSAPAAVTAPPQPEWPAGLREFLQGRGYDTSTLTESQARQIAATL